MTSKSNMTISNFFLSGLKLSSIKDLKRWSETLRTLDCLDHCVIHFLTEYEVDWEEVIEITKEWSEEARREILKIRDLKKSGNLEELIGAVSWNLFCYETTKRLDDGKGFPSAKTAVEAMKADQFNIFCSLLSQIKEEEEGEEEEEREKREKYNL
jgi:hypothetical protein